MPVRTDWTALGEVLERVLEGAAPEAAPAPADTTAPPPVGTPPVLPTTFPSLTRTVPTLQAVRNLRAAFGREELEVPCDCPSCRSIHAAGGWNTSEDPHRRRAVRAGRVPLIAPQVNDPETDAEYAGLKAQLSMMQWASFLRYHQFTVNTRGGEAYVVRLEPSGNVYRCHDGARLCLAHPSQYAPLSALLASQVWLLVHDEAEFLRRCNVLGYVAYLPEPGRAYPPYSHIPVVSYRPYPTEAERRELAARVASASAAVGRVTANWGGSGA